MRMVFLDEAGTGDPAVEPYLVIAGVIVHADKQWKAIERRLERLWLDHMPRNAPPGYSFHATELYSAGKVFDRERFDREARWSILDMLVAIPCEFNLPIVVADVRRANFPTLGDAFAEAFINVAGDIEAYMRVLPNTDEVASVILEDNHAVRMHVKDAQRFLQDPNARLSWRADERDRFWLTRVMGEPHFEGKSGISLLQIADACAFTIKRKIMGKTSADRFFQPLLPQIVWHHNPRTQRGDEGLSS